MRWITAPPGGWRRIALAGCGELAEIATLCATERDVELVGILDPDAKDGTFAGLPVRATLKALPKRDALLVTDLRAPQATYDALTQAMQPEKVLTPPLLGVSRQDTEQPS